MSEKGKSERKCNRFSSGNSLSGKIKCGECGKNFRRITTHSGEVVWRCAGRVEKDGNCTAETVKQIAIDALLSDKFGSEISMDDAYMRIESILVSREKFEIVI